MASQLQQFEAQAQALQQPGAKGDIAPVLQQLNMTLLRTRTQDLHTAIGRILHAFHTNPSIKWSEVLSQFAMVNVELLNLVDDIKPILKMFVVYPKNVNADNAPILPIMLSSKLLPEMEAEETALKEQLLAGIANLPLPMQTDKLQRQIEAIRSSCDLAEKVIVEARKVYGLGNRQGPVALATLDKLHATRIAEQERQLRAATNFGEGLRVVADQQHQQPTNLPQHLSAAFAGTGDGRTSFYGGTDGGYSKTSVPVLPPTGLKPSGQQQQATPVASRVQTPTQSIGAGVGGLMGASPPNLPYMVNSPRSGNYNVSSPSQQQSQTPQQLQQAAYLQRTKQVQQLQLQAQLHQQVQQAHLQKQQQQQQQQQQQHHQQQQQLRHPTTPPIPAQVGGQLQGQVAQPLLQQHKQQLQQQSQGRLLSHHQQAQAQQLMQQQVLQLQQERQHAMQQQQLQSSQLQAAQNTVQQGNQIRPQIGQQGLGSNLYNSGTPALLNSNMNAMSQPMQSQTLLHQRIQQFQQGALNTNQLSATPPQQNNSSMLSDSWGASGVTQNSSNLGLPLQQQQQATYMNMFNNQNQQNFGQNRQQPPPS